MVATSPSMWSHSWSEVNSVVMNNPLAFIGVGNEGHGRDLQRQALAAHLGEDICAVGRKLRRQIAHRDRGIEARTKAAGGDLTDRLAGGGVREQQRAFAHRRAALRKQSDTAARRAFLKMGEYLFSARKSAGAGAAAAAALLHRPFQRALDRRGRGVDVVAVETQPGLEPQA